MADNDRADIERRLRIRRRNLERLEQEAREVEEAEAPPAVLGRLQAQIRVEREEIRLLEGQVSDGGRVRARSEPADEFEGPLVTGEEPRRMRPPSIIVRVVLGLVATAVLLIIVLIVAPRGQGTRTAIPPTHTISPTFTAAAGLAGQGMAAITETGTLTAAQSVTIPMPAATPTPAPTATPTVPPPTPTPAAITGSVTADPLNVRSGPGTNFDALTQLSVGDVVTVTGRNAASDWLAISTVGGQSGWVAAQFVTATGDVRALPVAQQ